MSERRAPYRTGPVSVTHATGAGQRICLTVPGHPPSSNHLYPSLTNGRRVLSTEGRQWQQIVAVSCYAAGVRSLGWPQRDGISVDIEFVGLSHRRDIDGAVKACMDAVFSVLGADDRWVEELRVRRVQVLNKPHLQETRVCLSEIRREG